MSRIASHSRFDGVVLFSMSGGVFNGVLSDVPGLKVIVIDWDNIAEGDSVGSPLSPDSLSLLTDDTRALVEESLATADETT